MVWSGWVCGIAIGKVKLAFHKFKILVSVDALVIYTIFPFIVTMALLKSKIEKKLKMKHAMGQRSFCSVRSVLFLFYCKYMRNNKNCV